MTGKRLRRQSSWRAVAALVVLPVWSAACELVGPPDVTLFDSPDCLDTGSLSLSGLRPQVPVDYMELRERASGGAVRVLSDSGTRCANAKDFNACDDALQSIPTGPGFHPCTATDCGHSLATTTGDLVTSYVDAKSLLGFLGTIDTPMEAVLWVYAQGYELSCTNTAVGGVRAALNGDGYEVLASLVMPSCNPTTVTGYQFHVTRRGALTYFSSWPVAVTPGLLPCP